MDFCVIKSFLTSKSASGDIAFFISHFHWKFKHMVSKWKTACASIDGWPVTLCDDKYNTSGMYVKRKKKHFLKNCIIPALAAEQLHTAGSERVTRHVH